jgi:hypothetical protein
MEQLQIKDISPEFKQALKLAAVQRGISLKQFVVDELTKALAAQQPIAFEQIPPASVGGTDGELAQQLATGNTSSPRTSPKVHTVVIKHSGKHSQIQWGKK